MEGQMEKCWVCGSAIARTKFLEMQAVERKRAGEAETVLRKRLEEEFQKDLDAERKSLEKRSKVEAAVQMKGITAERDAAVKKAKDLEAREAAVRKQAQQEANLQLKKMSEDAERRRQNDVAEARASLEKDRDRALLKQQAGFSREREALQRKAQDLERRLQKKTANEIGDGAEIDLVEDLREAFQGDRITRVQKGQTGADIWHEVIHNGKNCGRIIYDSKNRRQWQDSYAVKLRDDQVEAKAEHAILSSTAFPRGQKELCVCIESGVIVVSPARVVHIAGILRNLMIRMWTLGLTTQARAGKINRLYQFIISDPFGQKLREIGTIAQAFLALDVDEKKEHDKVWRKRGLLATKQGNLARAIETEIGVILEGSEEDVQPA